MSEAPRFYHQETTGIRYPVGDLYGYPDSLIRARTGSAYQFAVGELLSRDCPTIVVDFGSGRGHGIISIQDLGADRIISIDKYEPYLSIAQKKGLAIHKEDEGVEFIVGADLLPLATGSVDAIFFMHTIEHMKSPLVTLKDMHRVLKPDGSLIVVTPDQKNLVGNSPYDEQIFTEKELSKLLSQAGFSFELYYGVPSDIAWKVHRRKYWLAHHAQFTGRMRNHASPALWDALVLRSGISLRELNTSDFKFQSESHPRSIDILAFASKSSSENFYSA